MTKSLSRKSKYRRNAVARIGIYGGTFDPPHIGHMRIAEQAKKQLHLDKIYFIPAYIPPHKIRRQTTSGRHRIAMIKLAIGKRKYFHVSTIELRRKGVSYTIDTIRSFQKKYPHSELTLIIGADNYLQFKTWKSPEKIKAVCSLAVYKRKGSPTIPRSTNPGITNVNGRFLNISSTEIRKLVFLRRSISKYAPLSVARYIKQNFLYSKQSSLRNKDIAHEGYNIHR